MARHPADQSRPPPDHQKELLKLFGSLAHRHSAWQVFADFVEAATISLSNAVDWAQRDPREERYMALIKRYKPHELATFPKMMTELTLAMEEEPSDILGRTFHDLELHNKWSGQFFSPYSLCRMMAKMTLGDEKDVRDRIAKRGFLAAQEPCCGSGAMVIALAHEMRELGINYQQHLHVTAVDVDPKCVHMAYVQFAFPKPKLPSSEPLKSRPMRPTPISIWRRSCVSRAGLRKLSKLCVPPLPWTTSSPPARSGEI